MMSPSKLGLFASLALAANAVLIPPSMAAAGLGDEALAISPFTRTVAVDCPACAVATVDGKTLSWEKGAGNAFVSATTKITTKTIQTSLQTLQTSLQKHYKPTTNVTTNHQNITTNQKHYNKTLLQKTS